jgi:TolB-like protein/class 3 adenylate cyclase
MPDERRLAAILFTDIVGYTALMAESEERGLAARARHRELVAPLVAEHRGEAIEARGDESLSVFSTALDAVRCALAIEDRLAGEPDLRLHIGIHLGDIVLRDGEVSGDGVNIASRICALSPEGGLCVSGEVYQSVRNQGDIEAVSLGDHDLKNVGRPVAVYALGRPGAIPTSLRPPSRPGRSLGYAAAVALVLLAVGVFAWWSRTPPTLQTRTIRSIAVLPLENLSGDPAQEYFTAGLTEALISDLARIASLGVVSRTSVMQYAGSRKRLPEIADELGVDAVVEGSVLRAGDSVRVTVQLVDARSDRHIWSQSYERDLRDVLALQNEVSHAISREIQLQLAPDVDVTDAPPVVPEAYDAFLKGVFFLEQQGRANHLKAVQLLERAVELDPTYAPAWAQLANSYT